LGGPPEVANQVAKQFAKYKLNFQTIVVGKMDAKYKIQQNQSIINSKSIFDNRFGLSFKLLNKNFIHAIKSAEVVLTHAHYGFPTLVSTFFSRGRILIMPHGNLEPIKYRKSRLKKALFDKIFILISKQRNVEFIVASSNEIDSVKRRFPHFSCRSVGLGIHKPKVEFMKLRKSHAKRVVITLSRIDPIKRIDLCIKALGLIQKAQFKKVELKISGYGDSSTLEKMVDVLGLSDQVKFVGWLGQSEREKFLKEATILLQPADNDNFAISVAEAITRGIPVIVSDQVGMAEFVEKFQVGMVIPASDERVLAQAIERVFENIEYFSTNCLQFGHLLHWDEVFKKNWLPLFCEFKDE
jgi:glycosyltransferase involved in cell wall biosynthesis